MYLISIQASQSRCIAIMRYEISKFEWVAIKPMLPNKPRGVPRVNDRRLSVHAPSRSTAIRSLSEGLCCKSRFALVLKNSKGQRRGFRVKM
jgi:hypothetical protein